MSKFQSLPFSKSRVSSGTVYLSGEMPLNTDGSVPEGISAQTELTLDRIKANLASEGLSLTDVVSVTVYLVNANDFAEFNTVYRKHFVEPFPTRTTVVTQLVVPRALIEITVTAAQRATV